MSKIKIFVISHNNEKCLLKEDMHYILVGKHSTNTEHCYTDNIGDNISSKNSTYNEMTAIYWLWKHYEEIGSSDYISIEQYRRLFFPNGKSNYYEMNEKKKQNFIMNVRNNNYLDILQKSKIFIAPYPMKCKSVYHQFKSSHGEEPLQYILKIIKKLYPNDLDTANQYLYGKKCYLYNMFVFDKKTFFRYCAWVFPILEEYEKITNSTDRLFISERLTGIFFLKLIKEGMIVKHLPIVFFTNKKNIHYRKGKKKILLNKITFFIPNIVWIRIKRKRFYTK